jgi:nitrogenase molybdenum-cofactor synthesis protein NifE
MDTNTDILAGRRGQVYRKGASVGSIECDKQSLAGSVSQRACVFCGSRVVLYPVADALHLVHGPIGCAAYTWDIRGALSSGPELHRMSFSTDLCEQDVIYGGESKLEASLRELIERYDPRAAFVYVTCIVGLIGDDVDAICSRVEGEVGIPVIPVHSPGFSGTKKTGYLAACEALYRLVGTGDTSDVSPLSINIVGEFNIAGEAWLIRRYYERMGLQVVSIMTGDGRVDDIRRSHGAALNVVQCSGSMMNLALMMQERYGTPCIHVSYFGPQDMAAALYAVADHFDDEDVSARTRDLVRQETAGIMPEMMSLRKRLRGKRAAVYTGGAFKALSLVRSLRTLGIKTVMAGSQTGSPDDYELLQGLCDDGAVLLDDTNPVEIARFVQETGVDLLIGGVKERPIAFKLGLAFVDHNHERKTPLAGFEGALNFAHEVYASVCSPVWKLHPGPARRGGTA